MSRSAEAGFKARNLLLNESSGVLSTHSQALPGYPFGSIVPYCFGLDGRPVILISTIAQHTKNIKANHRVSLTVAESGKDDVQAASRTTIVADAHCVTAGNDEHVLRYYEYFPDSRDYHATHDFDFYALVPVRVRFIGGFGEIHWLEPGDVFVENPFTRAEESGMVTHMNADHQDTMQHYCQQASITMNKHPLMAGIDSEGFHLLVDQRIERFTFDKKVTTPVGVRKTLVEMARRT